MKWKCNQCGKEFTAHLGQGHKDFFSFENPVCPECGSDDTEELVACDLCGTEWQNHRLESYGKLYICPGCKAMFKRAADEAVNQIWQYARGRKHTEEIRSAFAEFLEE